MSTATVHPMATPGGTCNLRAAGWTAAAAVSSAPHRFLDDAFSNCRQLVFSVWLMRLNRLVDYCPAHQCALQMLCSYFNRNQQLRVVNRHRCRISECRPKSHRVLTEYFPVPGVDVG